MEVTEQPEGFRFTSIRELVNRTLNQNFGTAPDTGGLSSGFKELDEALGGFRTGQLYTIAVRPGMGKTAFLLSLVNNMAIKTNHGVAVFSSERSNMKMTSRLIESETGMSLHKLLSGQMKESERDHMLSLLNNIAKARIFIDDSPGPSAAELLQKIKTLKAMQDIDIIMIDYLELLGFNGSQESDRPAMLARLVGNIREAARELQLPILLFSQSAGHTNGSKSKKGTRLSALPAFIREHSDRYMLLHRKDAFPRPDAQKNDHSVELHVSGKSSDEAGKVLPLNFIESIAKFTDFQ